MSRKFSIGQAVMFSPGAWEVLEIATRSRITRLMPMEGDEYQYVIEVESDGRQCYYRLDMQPDLFGAWCFIREWGCIGHGGQVREIAYATPTEAQAPLDRQRHRKERRGKNICRTVRGGCRETPLSFKPAQSLRQD